MRIVYLGAGAGGMYCGSCLHDNTLAAALVAEGADALLVPTYTPIRTDEEPQSQGRIFFGGINVYLQQRVPLFRYTPWPLDRIFDAPWLINWLAGRASAVDPADLGDLTVSMLRGEEGNQRKELHKLIGWLQSDIRPDVVHLSNAMLIGLARPIAQALDVPVVVTLSGEDVFLERLREPFYTQARDELRGRAADAAAFVSLNRYYADFMIDYMGLDPGRIRIVPHGLKLAGHSPRPARPAGATDVTIGYLARICRDKGLHNLAAAFVRLARQPEMPPLRLRVAGYLAGADRPYFDEIRRTLAEAGLADRFEYVGEVDRAGKIAFLHSLDMMCVPTQYRESKGLSIVEALANAVPVVLPAHGTFPELVADTGGGLTYEPGDSDALVRTLGELARDLPRARQLGQSGEAAIRDRYHDRLMARRHLDVYREVIDAHRGSGRAKQLSTSAGGPAHG